MEGVIEGSIEFVLGNFTLTLFVVGLITAAIVIAVAKKPRGPGLVSGAFLNQFILCSVAIAYLYNFVMHSVFGDFTARIIGWAQSPFQFEVAFASLGFSVVGFLAFGHRRALMVKFAALLGPAAFLWGDAAGHIYQIAMTGNTSAGNAGVILYSDILLPFIGFGLLWWHVRARRTMGTEPTAAVEEASYTVP